MEDCTEPLYDAAAVQLLQDTKRLPHRCSDLYCCPENGSIIAHPIDAEKAEPLWDSAFFTAKISMASAAAAAIAAIAAAIAAAAAAPAAVLMGMPGDPACPAKDNRCDDNRRQIEISGKKLHHRTLHSLSEKLTCLRKKPSS